MSVLPGVREKADQIIQSAVESGRIAPDGTASDTAALTPTFSKGTAALDPNTGRPVVPREQGEAPAFEAGKVALPTEGAAPAATAAVPATQTDVPAPAAAAGAVAAEAAAQEIVDRFAEFDEFEFDDPDLEGVKIPIRVPKQYSETAKRGYGRRTALDRAMSNYKNADPVFRGLVEDGRLNKLLPLIAAALDNKEYGEYVTGGFQRLQQGVPLIEQARAEAAAAGAVAAPGAAATDEFNPFVDPEVVTLRERTAAIERDWQAFQAERQQTQQTQRQQHEHAQQFIHAQQSAHQRLATMYPGVFNLAMQGEDPAFKAAMKYANDAGYMTEYGDPKAAIIFGGQGWRAMEAERLAATSSPAAAALGQLDDRLLNNARREAAAGAATVSGGAVAHAVPAPAPAKPGTKNPDGTMKDQALYMAEVQQWHQLYGRLQPA